MTSHYKGIPGSAILRGVTKGPALHPAVQIESLFQIARRRMDEGRIPALHELYAHPLTSRFRKRSIAHTLKREHIRKQRTK